MRSLCLCMLAFAACLTFTYSHAGGPIKGGDWPQWRGPERNGISTETGLLREWPKGGPKLLWDSRKVNKDANGFEDRFWSGGSLDELFDEEGDNPKHPMASVFSAAMNEWRRSKLESPRSAARFSQFCATVLPAPPNVDESSMDFE